MKDKYEQIKDIFEQVKEAIETSDFEEKHDKLLKLYSLALNDSDKPKDEQLFHRDLKQFVFALYKDVYDVKYARKQRR